MFKRRESKPEAGFTVGVCLNKIPVKGKVGLEIEVEGNKFPKPPGMANASKPVRMDSLPFWSYVHDGSLRGTDNAEYVLTKPIEFSDVIPAVDQLFDCLKDYGSVLADSNRTSVHVHLNCQNFHFNRLTSFLALWFILEEVLAAWAGDHRVGNLFCLRAKDAPGIITMLRRFITTDGRYELGTGLHYSGLNAQALQKLGSLEVRFLRGVTDPSVVVRWVGILERLYNLSEEFPDPRQIPALFSQEGPLSFFSTLLGDQEEVVRAGIDWNNDMIQDAMYDGVRLAQDLCYCRDWDRFQKVDLKPDPFGRDPRKMMKRMAAMPDFDINADWDAAIDIEATELEGPQAAPQWGPAPPQPGVVFQQYAQFINSAPNPFTNT